MVHNPFGTEEPPELESVLDALHDRDCREIVTELDAPMTAKEIAEETDVPLSTTYRKLDLLTEASLLEEGTELRRDGRHTSRYRVDFEEVSFVLDEHREFDVSIIRAPAEPEDRLATLWTEVRRET